MPDYTLQFYDLSSITTDDPDGFVNNGGYQFNWWSSTVTIATGTTSQALSITDTDNIFFDDDAGPGQTTNGGHTLNGTYYPDGTNIEAEYVIHVVDSVGVPYTIQFVSVSGDAWNIEGFVIHGARPPFGEPLTVTSTQDVANDIYPYATSVPSCFSPDSRILLASGKYRPASKMTAGDTLRLANGRTAQLDLILHSPAPPEPLAVRIRAGALGPNLPERTLILSPQHRVRHPDLDGLVPAVALTALPKIGRAPPPADGYVHLVMKTHAILLAEGLPCESFWPGPIALRGLTPADQNAVQSLMGAAPEKAAPFLTVGEAKRHLRSVQPVA